MFYRLCPAAPGGEISSRAKAQSRDCLSAARLKPGPVTRRFGVRRLAAAFPGQGLPCPAPKVEPRRGTPSPSPPRRRGSRLDSRLRGNDGRCCFPAFTARLKPGPDTGRFGVRRLAAAFPGQGLPCPDTRCLEALCAQAGNFLHQNEPKVIDNKADHKKRTQKRTQFQGVTMT